MSLPILGNIVFEFCIFYSLFNKISNIYQQNCKKNDAKERENIKNDKRFKKLLNPKGNKKYISTLFVPWWH
jgi:hypothetical protein